jgi:protease IV
MRVIGGLLRGVWHALDGVRKVLHLVLLLFLFGLLSFALRDSVPFVPSEAALVLRAPGSDRRGTHQRSAGPRTRPRDR